MRAKIQPPCAKFETNLQSAMDQYNNAVKGNWVIWNEFMGNRNCKGIVVYHTIIQWFEIKLKPAITVVCFSRVGLRFGVLLWGNSSFCWNKLFFNFPFSISDLAGEFLNGIFKSKRGFTRRNPVMFGNQHSFQKFKWQKISWPFCDWHHLQYILHRQLRLFQQPKNSHRNSIKF